MIAVVVHEPLGSESSETASRIREVYDAYVEANDCPTGSGPGSGCSNAVTVLIDRQMRIRQFGATYECGFGLGNYCGVAGMQSNPVHARCHADVQPSQQSNSPPALQR